MSSNNTNSRPVANFKPPFFPPRECTSTPINKESEKENNVLSGQEKSSAPFDTAEKQIQKVSSDQNSSFDGFAEYSKNFDRNRPNPFANASTVPVAIPTKKKASATATTTSNITPGRPYLIVCSSMKDMHFVVIMYVFL